MDKAYESALATIVAVSGNDSDAGLPGVDFVPRSKQPSARVRGRILVSKLPHVCFFLERSKWVTRGWTYQEAMLSGQCMSFLNAQVYFICKTNDLF